MPRKAPDWTAVRAPVRTARSAKRWGAKPAQRAPPGPQATLQDQPPAIRPLRVLRMIGLALGGTAATAAAGWMLYPVVRPTSSAAELEGAEAALVQRIRDSGVLVEQRMVGLAGGEQQINTLIVRRGGAATAAAAAAAPAAAAAGTGRTLVLIHGLGGGVGLWSKNLAPLCEHFDTIYAFDLLGFGRSSRPVAPRGTTADLQAWWVSSVENWRVALAEDEPVLRRPFEVCGHSLGAFVSASYTAAYPANVSRLILAAPVGLHDMAERIGNMSPNFKRILQTVLFLGLNRTR